MTTAAAPPAARIPAYSWYALGLLTAVYILNFLDRSLMFILLTEIKKEMTFTDLQLALLGTMAFVIFYTALGIPFGRLADRYSRKTIIAIGLAVWSLFSGLTGFANGFWSIFFCRMMVGVGEATLGPAALSLLSDYFPPRLRATVNSVYSTGIAIGGGLAYLLGGWLGAAYGWRWAFYLLGFPGIALAVLVFLLREQPRGRADVGVPTIAASDWRRLITSRAFVFLCLGYAMLGIASNNLGIWGAAFFIRVHHVDIRTVGLAAFWISILVGIPAMVFGGWFSDRMTRVLPGGRMAFISVLAVLSVPLWLGLLFLNNLALVVLVNVLVYALAILWVGPATADVAELSAPHLRGLAIGVFFSAVNILAYGIASPLIGKLSDVVGVTANPEMMRYSLLVCPAACAIGAVLLWLGSRAKAAAAERITGIASSSTATS